MKPRASHRLVVMLAALLSAAPLAFADQPLQPWWLDGANPNGFLWASGIVGGVGGILKLLIKWERNPGVARLTGALGLGPFMAFLSALWLFKSYAVSDDLMRLLALCGGVGFCCDSAAQYLVVLVSRAFEAAGTLSKPSQPPPTTKEG